MIVVTVILLLIVAIITIIRHFPKGHAPKSEADCAEIASRRGVTTRLRPWVMRCISVLYIITIAMITTILRKRLVSPCVYISYVGMYVYVCMYVCMYHAHCRYQLKLMRGLWVSMSTGGRTAPSLTITFVVFGAADITTRAYLDRFPPVRLKVAGGLAACFFDLSSSGRFS